MKKRKESLLWRMDLAQQAFFWFQSEKYRKCVYFQGLSVAIRSKMKKRAGTCIHQYCALLPKID